MKRFNNIVYVSESGLNQDAALERAVTLAQNNQASLTVVEVVPEMIAGIGMPPGGPISSDLTAIIVQERQQQLERLITPYRDQVRIQLSILVGIGFLEVIRAVLKNRYDLVVKPARNVGFAARLFGSDDMHLLRKCPCPVWLLKPEEKANYQCIVAALDVDADEAGQPLNREILELASSLALSDFAELHLVHVWDAPEAGLIRLWAEDAKRAEKTFLEAKRLDRQRKMDDLAGKIHGWLGKEAYEYLSPRVHVRMGSVTEEVAALIHTLGADMVVMGTVARTGIPGFIIGNTAEAILDQLHCAVLAIKPAGFVTPVTQA